jgi:hypothetical protein
MLLISTPVVALRQVVVAFVGVVVTGVRPTG